jgi:hypothetical protein
MIVIFVNWDECQRPCSSLNGGLGLYFGDMTSTRHSSQLAAEQRMLLTTVDPIKPAALCNDF